MIATTMNAGRGLVQCMLRGAALALALAGGSAAAQAPAAAAAAPENAIQAITASQQGASVILKVQMKNAPARAPIGFTITNPARIALDFGTTANETGATTQDVNLGDVRSVNVVQSGQRSRLVVNLKRPLSYSTAIEGNSVIVTVDGSPAAKPAEAARTAATPAGARAVPSAPQQLGNIDFRRGAAGEGRVVVDLPNGQVAVDVRQQGDKILVDFLRTALPEALRRRLDVTDFGTPVAKVTTVAQGDNVRMTIEGRGQWEHSVYQSDTQLIVDVKPVKEDPSKLVQGTGYRGEKLSFNFQNVEVRAALQAIAEISGLNIVVSDSVTGSLTLRLTDVPWDQAIDVILQAKGLDMRKNGNVLWIAPKAELKLELEQRAQIEDVEPLRSEVFQLNYQKAEAFRTVFGIREDGSSAAEGKRSLLSKRGTVIIDPRTNQLFVTDIAAKIEDIRKLIQKTDVPTKQVLIEARLVEATDSFSRNLGAKLGFSDLRGIRGGDPGYRVRGNERVAIGGNYVGVGQVTTQTPDTGDGYTNTTMVNLPAGRIGGVDPTSIAFSLFSAAANRFVNLELSALEADGKGKIISSPRVVTEDKMVAVIEQGIELPYEAATSSGATNIQFKKANLRLEVTPQITPDGNVVLEVDVNKDSKGDETRAGFAINTQHVKTKVMVENGGTVVLGGIYQQIENNVESKVPLLGDIPVVGYLFKTTGRQKNKNELLVFITPKIVSEATTR